MKKSLFSISVLCLSFLPAQLASAQGYPPDVYDVPYGYAAPYEAPTQYDPYSELDAMNDQAPNDPYSELDAMHYQFYRGFSPYGYPYGGYPYGGYPYGGYPYGYRYPYDPYGYATPRGQDRHDSRR